MCKIEIATPQDFNEISDLISALLAEPGKCWEPSLAQEDIEQNGKNIVLIAKESAKIIGYLSLHSRNSFQKDESADFEVGIHPNHRSQGIATDLIKFAIHYIEDNTKIKHLDALVRKDNQASKKMCEKLGFRVLIGGNLGFTMRFDIER